MRRAAFVRSLALAGVIAVGAIGIQGLHAGEIVTKGTSLFETGMDPGEGKNARLTFFELPAGWVGSKHKHPNDEWIFILEGYLVVESASLPDQTLGPGKMLHQKRGNPMRVRNMSDTDPVKFVQFEVAEEGGPSVVPVE